jgi:glycosyltransferase involved in cell wall biosynthesis
MMNAEKGAMKSWGPDWAVKDRPILSLRSTVAALIPHYRCEEWLEDCLESLVAQTRPLDAIVVIDDASPQPPLETVGGFPSVTLLAAGENSGPYRLIQEVISSTGYDAYLFNDADDWSAPHRLEILLAEAQRTGAELVGSQEVRIMCPGPDAFPYAYPRDVNGALAAQPHAFPLLHPTSLVARDLVMRIGGFATGMRFSGDAEFLRRAAHAARVVNVPQYLYFRRKRPGALTTSPDTGFGSPARSRIHELLRQRAEDNAAAVAQGQAPDLEPFTKAPPVTLKHLLGPGLLPSPEVPIPSAGLVSQNALGQQTS